MFAGFANVWTIVGLARDFPAGRPHAMQVAGEKVVLFRGADGTLGALIDRCPHRGVALSLGKLRLDVPGGVLECPFHGWQFDVQGRNVHVPWNPDAKCENLSATALPVREVGGLVWLHTGPTPASEPQVPATLADPRVVVCGQKVRWAVHWTRAMENMLDSPHLPFVHKGTIGRGLARLVATRRMDVKWTPTDYGARIDNVVEGREQQGRLEYRFPNAMELFIDPPGGKAGRRTFRMLAVCLPESDTHTQMCIYTMRDFARSRLLDPLFAWSNARIAREDQAVLESSQPLIVPPAAEEKSVRTDAPTLAFRKLWFDRLKDSAA